MKITKTQLQNIIREELDALSEEENLDEFLGGLFGKKKKPKMSDEEKFGPAQELDPDRETMDQRRARKEKEAAARKAKRDKAYDARAKERETQSRFDAMGAESDRENRRSAKRNRMAGTNRSARGFKSNTAGAGRYAANRKDESKVNQRIREEVAKAVKDHFKK